MTVDAEMENWREAWESSGECSRQPDIFDVRQKARRKEFRLRMFHLVEFIWALFLLSFSCWMASRYPSAEMTMWAVVIWALTLLAEGYSLWNWRMLWRAETKSTLECAQIYEKYCIAGLRYIRFGYGFLAVNLAITIPWLSWKFFSQPGTGHLNLTAYLVSLGLIAGLTAGYLFWFHRARKNRHQELEQLSQYRRSLEDNA